MNIALLEMHILKQHCGYTEHLAKMKIQSFTRAENPFDHVYKGVHDPYDCGGEKKKSK